MANNKGTTLYSTATTNEGRENEMIALAVNLAEQQLRNGTASSSVITHYLKLATEKEKLEREKIRSEVLLAEKKGKAYDDAHDTDDLYRQVIDAMRGYTNATPDDGFI